MDRLSVFRNMRVMAVCCLFTLTGCSDDTADGNRLPDGEYPMTFTAAVDGLTVTRAATADGMWDSGSGLGTWMTADRISVKVGDEIKTYTLKDMSGSSATLTATDPFYWQTSDETKNVSAWYCGDGSTGAQKPNASKIPTSWTVQQDQSAANSHGGIQQSDFLYAAEKKISFGDASKSLSFFHQTARVVINIKKEEVATTASAISRIRIGNGNLALTGSYTPPAIGDNIGQWNADASTQNTIIPKLMTTNSDIYLRTYTALVIPQDMTGKKFIAITMSDKNIYYYTPKSGEADLKGGYQYTYDITVKQGYINVVATEGSGTWTKDNPFTVKSQIVAKGFTARDLKPGDYYYSDGTWSDGGYRKYTDKTTAVLDIKPVLISKDGLPRTVVGIVYWAGDPTKITPVNEASSIKDKSALQGDATLRKIHAGCVHGLAVALNGEEVLPNGWQQTSTSVQAWLKKSNNNKIDDESEDRFLSMEGSGMDGDIQANIQGFNNTTAIEKFNKSADNTGKNIVYAVQPLIEYRTTVKAPDASSGWYLPSMKELTLLCAKDEAVFGGTIGTTMREVINKKLESLNVDGITTQKLMETDSNDSYYFSSTENSNSSKNSVWGLNFYNGKCNGCYKSDTYRLRFTLAF